MTPFPEEDTCRYTFYDRIVLESKLLLAVIKLIFIASHSIWEKKKHSASVWVTQKVKSEKETGEKWNTCYYKTQINMRQIKKLKQAYIGSCPRS